MSPHRFGRIRCSQNLPPRSTLLAAWLLLLASAAPGMHAQAPEAQPATLVFFEQGFPAADTAPPTLNALKSGLTKATFADSATLPRLLASRSTRLLVLPFGSAYPESCWPDILRFLDRGGDLLVLGGKPFTRAAFRDPSGWHLRVDSVAAPLELFISDYQTTPGSDGLRIVANANVAAPLPEFHWSAAFSPVVRLSVVQMYERDGATGDEDADLTTLAWGDLAGRHLAAPAYLLDHKRLRFVGGRWLLVSCKLEPRDAGNPELLARLQSLALRRDDRFELRPRMGVFVPGEPLRFDLTGKGISTQTSPGPAAPADTLRLEISAESGETPLTVELPAAASLTLPEAAAQGSGLHTVVATRVHNGAVVWKYKTGFWMRDLAYLASGPQLTAHGDYFEFAGRPLPVAGTTYMSSDVARLYLLKPNPAIWDEDMAQIRAHGLTMIRTGLWSTWDRVLAGDGTANETTLRNLEALFMSARHHGLAVQFNLFAFLPEVLGGANPYLDPAALRAQTTFVSSLAERFRGVPFLAWDLINEPSFNQHLWTMAPSGDVFEQRAWKDWLAAHYPDKAARISASGETSFGMGRIVRPQASSVAPEIEFQDPLALPSAAAFQFDQVRNGYNPLQVHDYFLFAQDTFTHWVQTLGDVIRAAAPEQLLTVGQEEYGVASRLSPAFYGSGLDFTSDHMWWDYDNVLWTVLAAKLPGKPMLLQEVGEQRQMLEDAHLRLNPKEEAWQLERNLAVSLAQGAGALEWVWNVNPYMPNDNETPIGAIRPDGTEKPEAFVLEDFGAFTSTIAPFAVHLQPPPVSVVASQALQFSDRNALAIHVQQHALRALAFYAHTPARLVGESRIADIVSSRLVILPSPQSLTAPAWEAMLRYVETGGTLLITGPVARDEFWRPVDRFSTLSVRADVRQLLVRQGFLQLPGDDRIHDLSFPSAVQREPVEYAAFADNASVQTIEHGRGKILWAALPVEATDNFDSIAALYSYALRVARVEPSFELLAPLSPGVLVFPSRLTGGQSEAVLYSFASESLEPAVVDLKDLASGARIHFTLPAQRGAAILLSLRDGRVTASFGAADHPGTAEDRDALGSTRP